MRDVSQTLSTDWKCGRFSRKYKIVSTRNKAFRKNFLHPERIGTIPEGGYTDNRKESKKNIALLMLEGKKEGKKVQHGRNGKESQLPDSSDIRVDDLCEETPTVYELNGYYWHGHTCFSFRDIPIV